MDYNFFLEAESLARRLWLMTFDSDGVRLIQINAGLA
jgi:hypothetical protein